MDTRGLPFAPRKYATNWQHQLPHSKIPLCKYVKPLKSIHLKGWTFICSINYICQNLSLRRQSGKFVNHYLISGLPKLYQQICLLTTETQGRLLLHTDNFTENKHYMFKSGHKTLCHRLRISPPHLVSQQRSNNYKIYSQQGRLVFFSVCLYPLL